MYSVSKRHQRALEKIFGDISVEKIGERYYASAEGHIKVGRTIMPLCMGGVSTGEAIKNLFDQVARCAKSPRQLARHETHGARVYTAQGNEVSYNRRDKGMTIY
jgi:ribosomal protein L34